MNAKRRRNLIQAVALVAAVVILNVVFPQPLHVTIAVIVPAVALGAGFGTGASIADDLIKRWRK